MGTWEGFWSERAGWAESDSDRMAALLEKLCRRYNLYGEDWRDAHDVLRDWRAHRDQRYRALPAGPTLTGNLQSGGISL